MTEPASDGRDFATTMTDLRYASRSDIGAVRRNNQDSVGVWSGRELACGADGLFVLADGMGGHAGGEVASKLAVGTVRAAVDEILSAPGAAMDERSIVDAMREAAVRANQAVWHDARRAPELRGMGTTCVAALYSGRAAILCNVGDSRAYVMRGGKLTQVTQDHSLVQEYVRAGELTGGRMKMPCKALPDHAAQFLRILAGQWLLHQL